MVMSFRKAVRFESETGEEPLVRTQVQLRLGQMQRLKELAAEKDVSLAEVVRRAVDDLLDERRERAAWDRALSSIGRFQDREGRTDVGARHDEYLARIYAGED